MAGHRLKWCGLFLCGVGLVGCGDSDKCSGTGIVLHVLSG